MSPRRAAWLLGCLALTLCRPGLGGELELAYQALDLPGAPAQILPFELDGDPGPELAIVVAYTAWEEIATEELSEIDAVEGLVAVMTIVPALLENRELWVFDRHVDGSWHPWGASQPLELATDVVSLEATDLPSVPLLALTDAGADAIRPRPDGDGLERVELIRSPTAVAGTGAFLPHLEWVHDLDDDSWPDLLLPAAEGWRVYMGSADGFATQASQHLAYPDFDAVRTPWRRDLPLPRVRDVDGDGLPELLAPHPSRGWDEFFIYRNQGGRFSPALGPMGLPEKYIESKPGSENESDEDDEPEQRVVFFDDLDGDGRAEYVTQEEISAEAAGMKDMAHAKVPPHRYRLFDAAEDLSMRAEPRWEFVTDGYSFPGPSDIRLPGGLWDLDGDGRRDLVTLTLDFSILQAVRVLVTKSIKIGLDFHLLCQQTDGSFAPTPGLDLSGEFRLNLNNFRQGQLSLFAGDFDGDGRRDFVQMGRGHAVSVHRGADGCRFPAKPDLEIDLVEAPKNLALVEVADLDDDGLADLAITQPRRQRRGPESLPVRLDLYLSGGGP